MANSTYQSPGNLASIMKSTWTSDRLETAFYDETPWLDELERTNRYTIGDVAKVPIHKGRSGGYTVTDAEGGSLNNPTRQKAGSAQFGLTYNWKQIGVEFGALNQARGGSTAVANALDLEVTGGLADLRFQVARQAVSNGDALIAKTAANSSTNTIVLDSPVNGSYGQWAVSRGFLHPDLEIDIGTAANPTAIASDVVITGVTEGTADNTTPTSITVSGSAITTTTSHFISIHGARNADGTSKEMVGLRQIYGSQTTPLGGLDPTVAGNEFWKPAAVDTTTTTLTLDLMLSLQMAVFQKTGVYPRDFVTSAKQLANYYTILQNQVRFTGDGNLGAGNVEGNKWNGLTPMAYVSVPDPELYLFDKRDMLLVTGEYSKPAWVSDIEGLNQGLNWVQGTTRFQDAIVYALGLGVKRRNSGAAALALRS